MAFSEYWRHVEILTVAEAAALWCEREPLRTYAFDLNMPDDFFAIKRMLISATETGQLKPEQAAVVDLDRIKVARVRLKAFAESKKQFPAFLFDTLLPVVTGKLNLTLDDVTQLAAGAVIGGMASPAHGVEAPMLVNENKIFSPTVVVQVRPTGVTPEPKNKGGRPAEHDWDAMIREIIWIANIDGLPATKAELVRKLQAWFATNGREPAQSEVYKRVSPIYDAFETQGRKPNG